MTTKRLARAGLAGPPVFAMIVVVVTAIEWRFLHRIGWSAGLFDNPDPPWPSSTALGDYGFLQIVNFLFLGASVLALSVAVRRLLDVRRRVGPTLLSIAGAALLASSFRTDYATVHGDSPSTWNGTVHAIAFFVLALATMSSMFVLASQFRRDERWRRLIRPSLAAGVIALAAFVANFAGGGNLFFYVFLGCILSWLMLVAAHVRSLAADMYPLEI